MRAFIRVFRYREMVNINVSVSSAALTSLLASPALALGREARS